MRTTALVRIADYLNDTVVEEPVLAGVASVDLARARDESELLDGIAEVDALIVYLDVRLTDATFSRAERLRGVVRGGVGYDNVDVDAAAARGIVVCNVPDYGSEEVADHAMMLLLATARHLVPGDSALRAGRWDLGTLTGMGRLRGRRLGLVGCGRIGTAVAIRAKAFGLEVAFYDPFAAPGLEKALGVGRRDSLPELLRDSNFVSIHCYLDSSTHHLIDAEALAALPRGAVLVNTARGGIVDQGALIEALESGQLGGAGLDVFEREPLDDDRLRGFPNVVLTPHSAYYSVEGFEEMRRKTAEEARRLVLGEPPRCPVNRDRLVGPRVKFD